MTEREAAHASSTPDRERRGLAGCSPQGVVTSEPAEDIRFEPDEPCSMGMCLAAALQGVAMVLTAMVLTVTITVRASGSHEVGIWPVFASLVIAGAMTALQAGRFGRIGTGHLLIMGPTLNFVALGALAVAVGGPSLLASLVVVATFVHLVLALWLPKVRRIITPTVSGTMLMLIAVTLLPFAVAPLQEVPPDSPRALGAVIALVTLALTVVLALRARGAWRLWSPLLSIAAGSAVAVPFGAYEFGPVLDANSLGTELFGASWGMLLDNGIISGALCAVLISAGMRLTMSAKRGSRLDVPLTMSSLPAIDGFVRELVDKHGWNDTTSYSLSAASEEILIILLESSDRQPSDDAPSLIVRAHPDGDLVELEFLAVLDEENIEDRLTYLTDEAVSASGVDVSELPLRLLRHYADSARHQKYYGLDVVTVWIRTTAARSGA